MSDSATKLRAVAGSWMLVFSMLVASPVAPITTGPVAQTAGNTTFPQTAGNVGGFVVEVEDLGAGNVAVETVTTDTSNYSSVEMAKITFYNDVSLQNVTITKTHPGLSEDDGYTRYHAPDTTVDRVTVYTSEVYAERWASSNDATNYLWTTSPETSDPIRNSSGSVLIEDLKLNSHTFASGQIDVNTVRAKTGTYDVELNVSCDGC